MYLAPDDQKKFPKFTDYIKIEFPKLTTNRPIIYGLKKWGKMSGADAAKYLKWGPPAPLLKLMAGAVGPEDAIIGFPETIRIATAIVDLFEHKENLSRSTQTSADGDGVVITYPQYPVYKNSLGKELYSIGAEILLTLVVGHAMKVAKTLRYFSWDIERGFAKDVYGGLTTLWGDPAL
jgi:hypothetical protein